MRAAAVIAGALTAPRAVAKPAWKKLVEEKAEERRKARKELEQEEAERQHQAEDAARGLGAGGANEGEGGDGEGYLYTVEEVPLAEALQKWELAVKDVRCD